jgi:hypothetical protein
VAVEAMGNKGRAASVAPPAFSHLTDMKGVNSPRSGNEGYLVVVVGGTRGRRGNPCGQPARLPDPGTQSPARDLPPAFP